MNSQTIRIVTLDSYMCSPIKGLDALYSEFRGSSINQVPVLRLFGSIPTGEKICVHIHGVFPYLYIPFDGTEDANSLMYKIAADIDKAVNISLNQATSHMHHIYKITLVQGIPMYGYHNKEHQFFKIHLYNPILLRKVTALLMNESTLGKLYQPHEAHLNFTLQFMIDYNLHGMSNMILSKMKYRQGSKEINVDPEFLLPASVNKITICELEGDCLAEDILNREEVACGNIGANPGIATLWADEQQRRRNKGLDSQIEHLLELKRTNVPPTNSHLSYKQVLSERLSVFSNEKNVVEKINSSVYPAETPSNVQIQNASMIDSQSTTNLTDSSIISLDETLEPSTRLSVTFDEDAQKLLQILMELEQANEKLEEDSILTQLTKEDQEENQKEIEENELDFSMSIEDVTTPTKIILEKYDEEVDDDDDDVLNTTLIPQLDGCCDENVELSSSLLQKQIHRNGSCKTIRNTRSLTKICYIKIQNIGRDMPLLDQDYPPIENSTLNKSLLTIIPYSFAIVPKKKNIKTKNRIIHSVIQRNKKCVKRRKLTRKEKKEREMKNNMLEVKHFENKIKKLKREDLLAAVMKKLHKKENELILFLEKNRQPRFRVIPKDQVKGLLSKKLVDENQTSKVKILSDIIVKMSNYIEPTLHLTVKYPNRCCFIYTYNNGFVPEATKIPSKIFRSCNKLDLETYIKQYSTTIMNKVEYTKINQRGEFVTMDIEEKRDTSDYIKKIEEIDKFATTKIEEKDETYLFSNQYLSDVKDPSILLDMHKKTDDDLIKMAENLREQLKTHITILQSAKSTEQDKINFSCEVERFNILDTIKCLKTEESDNIFENNNNNKVINFNEIEDSNFNTEIFESESVKSKITNAQNNTEISSFQNSNRRLKKKVFKEPTRRSSRIKNQQNCLSLDGTVDDSSSEEEKPILRRSSRTTRYKALPITLEKSPKAISSVDKEPVKKRRRLQ